MLIGIVASVIAFAAASLVSAKFWAGIALGCFVPSVKRGLVAAAAAARRKLGI